MIRKSIDHMTAYCVEQADELTILSPEGRLNYSGDPRAWLADKGHVIDAIAEIKAAPCSSDVNNVATISDSHSSKEEAVKEKLLEIDSPNSPPATIVQDAANNRGVYRYYFKALGGSNMALFVAVCASFTFCLRFPGKMLKLNIRVMSLT